ncbi:MAG: polysaccharide export protein, partial [Halioglobus sp.]
AGIQGYTQYWEYKTMNSFSTKFQPVAVLFSVLALPLLLTACGGSLPHVPSEERFADQDYTYLIGPGDTMEIFVWGNEELSTNGIVRPDGKFTTRLVEDLEASGKTSTQLARDIEVAYAEYVKHPVVSVILNGFVGVPSQQVRVVGEATQPRSVPYKKHMTLLDLMIDVGGMTEYAAGNESVLVRNENNSLKSYNIRLDDLLKDGDISANLNIMPGDIIIITESWF